MRTDFLRAALVGFPEAAAVGLPLAIGLAFLSPAWGGGVVVGLLAVAVGRLVGALFLLNLPREGRGGLAAGLMGVARLSLVAGIAMGGIAAGLPPLPVAGGLALPPLVLWAKLVILHKPSCQDS
ncbi:MAG: hypothetical protein XD60_1134 [Acetothermia bacterium 64_32]|nr:MAG: hypothetical protein XD60_1134 [Acetothermia bacterium 64_32]HAF70219.1 hypothetical protein [Candidatus Acetothermia bacterium]